MSPASGDVAQTPEPKSTSGFASVFKSLTGSRSTRNPNPSSSAASLAGSASLQQIVYPQSATYGGPPDYEHLYDTLKPGNPLADRLAAAEALRHAVQDYPLSGVTSIFKQGKDLIESRNPREVRVAGFELLTACVRQSTSTDPERLAFFHVLTAPANPEDFQFQLTALVELAKHGKDLSGFHYETLPLLTSWLRHTFAITSAARRNAGRNRSSISKTPLSEETNLSLLFAFIVDVIKFSFSVSSEEITGGLIDVVLYICVNTPLSGDLKTCIDVINAIVTYGDIPGEKLSGCVKVLCSIHCLVSDVQSEAWRSISNLCRSHNAQKTVRILLNILQEPPVDSASGRQTVREIRGALSVLEKLFAKDGQKGYPLVPFTLLIAALEKVVNSVEHTKVEIDVLNLILSLLSDEKKEIKENVIQEDWSLMFDVVIKCSQRALENPEGRQIMSRSHLKNSSAKDDLGDQTLATGLGQTLHKIILRIEALLSKLPSVDFFQKEDCVKFFVTCHSQLPGSCARFVIDYYMEYRYCYPSDLDWKDNTKMILSAFFTDRSRHTHIRLHALKAITDVFEVIEMMDEHEDPDTVQVFVMSILNEIGEEKDTTVLEKVISFAVTVAEKADEKLFHFIINAIRSSITSDRLQSPLASPPGSRRGLMNASRLDSLAASNTLIQTPSNVVTRGLILIFMRTMDNSSSKALRIFHELLRIAKSHGCETDARISALKMLSRLRADWANGIFLTPFTESDGLAVTLYRTAASLARKKAIDEAALQQRSARIDETSRSSRSTSVSLPHPQVRQPIRTASGLTRTMQRNHQMWMSPDQNALPEPASGKASLVLKSVLKKNDGDREKVDEEQHDGYEFREVEGGNLPSINSIHKDIAALDIGFYLDNIIELLKNGCDWEIYSYILVHLASQLTNQALFVGAIPQIRNLRELLCDQIKNGTYYDPPHSSGLRKADVGICLFQILNMVMSYHRHFQKVDQDDIVRTFLQGVGERTSKSCIHALSICCHELPGSTSKSLIHILQKMSQIITQSHVAVHILEFLACLARLPDLYVNFREEEYRIVFAICFRYLQYVRDQDAKEAGNRNSNPLGRNPLANLPADPSPAESNFQPNPSDDLPQYVYALAYHVIIFWFLALKLPDRAGQVSWITRNLVSTDANGREKIDEQAQVTLDFMQRVAYADVDESDADPSFTPELLGEIQKKRWIIGNSLITVQQATRGDWAQITKRQPSGTSCYIIQEKFIRPPPHQDPGLADVMKDGRVSDDNVKLPSHLLLQLSASTPLASEAMRPIPLPNNEDMERAVRTFNRLFTVDGHKVGVIYIGENQTNEVEILANIQGSSDYTEFLSRLGTLTKLKGAKFNTQGLDKESDMDGKYTFCWRDRVTEIVFHVTTQMPTNLDNDPQCIMKKRHIGNDFVNIIFNNSGLPFRFDTFPSQFNYVNIVITPESRASFVATRFRSKMHADDAFYRVQVMSKPGFPEVSPAAEMKIMSLAALPGFIRLLALNASVFSLVWANREGGENVSSWRSRLQAINRIRERYAVKNAGLMATSPPGTSNGVNLRESISSLRRSSVANFLAHAPEPISQRSSLLSTAETEVGPTAGEESLVESLDFSRWA